MSAVLELLGSAGSGSLASFWSPFLRTSTPFVKAHFGQAVSGFALETAGRSNASEADTPSLTRGFPLTVGSAAGLSARRPVSRFARSRSELHPAAAAKTRTAATLAAFRRMRTRASHVLGA